jgi:hypothetical protein
MAVHGMQQIPGLKRLVLSAIAAVRVLPLVSLKLLQLCIRNRLGEQ